MKRLTLSIYKFNSRPRPAKGGEKGKYMIIKAGTKLTVKHRRHGTFEGIALRDFDTETTEFYPIAAAKIVYGMVNEWEPGEEVPCRNTLCVIVPHGE